MRTCNSTLTTACTRIFVLVLILLAACKKETQETTPVHETGTVTDIDGNVYKTVKIGNQWWMSENLKVTKYRDGFFIHTITTDNTEWKNDSSGSYCEYDPNGESHKTYGFLYNWFVISDARNIAPDGWHIPSDEEWKELERQTGMDASEADKSGWRGTHEGEKLKIQALEGWSAYDNVWATNESGFTALGGNCRVFNGVMGEPSGFKQTGFWWTSSSSSDSVAVYRYLDYKNANIFRGQCSKNYGFSIRCVKD